MRITRQSVARQLAAKVVELVLVESVFEEGPRVDARRSVTLEIDVVPSLAVVLATKEVIEGQLVQAGRRGVRGEVPSDTVRAMVGIDDHHCGVPTDVGAQASFDRRIAREPGLGLLGDRVHVRGRDLDRRSDSKFSRPIRQCGKDETRATFTTRIDQGIKRIDPFRGLFGVDIG